MLDFLNPDNIFNYSGPLGKAFANKDKFVSSTPYQFFSPYKSKAHFFQSAVPIITGPLSFTLLAIESLAVTLYHLCRLLTVDLFRWDTNQLKMDLEMMSGGTVMTLAALVSAVASPLVNLIGVLGSLINTAKQHRKDNDYYIELKDTLGEMESDRHNKEEVHIVEEQLQFGQS